LASFCTSCAAALEPGAKFCGACGAVVDTPTPAVTAKPLPAQGTSHPHSRQYPALRIIAVILKILAVVTAVGGILSALAAGSVPATPYFPSGGAISALIVLVGILAGLCSALFLWASAEMIYVLLDIEENTRRVAG